MTTATERHENGTVTLTITIPWADIQKHYDEVVDEIVKRTEMPGFRIGKAPRNIVEEKLDKTKTYEEVLQHTLPEAYNQAVKEADIHPVVNPKVELVQATEGKDWIIKAHTCEKPAVDLGDYKKVVSELNSSKKKDLWVPGKDEKPENGQDAPKKPTLDELVTALISTVKMTLPDLLVENEVNRLLSDLIDQTKKLGLTVEQYLASTGRNAETIKKEYEEQSKRTLILEFTLEAIADKEGILVSDDDIDTVLKTAKSEEEKKALESQRYYLASILRRQKTLDFLSSL